MENPRPEDTPVTKLVESLLYSLWNVPGLSIFTIGKALGMEEQQFIDWLIAKGEDGSIDLAGWFRKTMMVHHLVEDGVNYFKGVDPRGAKVDNPTLQGCIIVCKVDLPAAKLCRYYSSIGNAE